MHRRNSILVQTRTDLILNAILIASCVYSLACFALSCESLSTISSEYRGLVDLSGLMPGILLFINFIAEWINVGTRKLPGKWSISLFNVCPGPHNDFHRRRGIAARGPRSAHDPYDSEADLGCEAYAEMPNNPLSSSMTQPSGTVNNRPAPPYRYPPAYGQQPQQSPLGM